MSSSSKTPAIVLTALMLMSLAAVVAPGALGQDQDQDRDLPVEFSSAANKIDLYLWRDEGNDNRGTCSQAGGQDGGASCVLRANTPGSGAGGADTEVYNVQQEGADQANANSVARFALDTRSATQTAEGAVYPFALQRGAGALKFQFFYDSDAVCRNGLGQQLVFDIAFYRTTGAPPASGDLDVEPIGETSETACNTPAGSLTDGQAHSVSTHVDLLESQPFAEGEYLVVDVSARNDGDLRNLQWSLLFEDSSRPSKLTLRTSQAVEYGLWPADKGGDLLTALQPNAPESDRLLQGYLALRSAFGGAAVPNQGFTGAVVQPDGTYAQIGGESLVDLVEVDVRSQDNGARKVLRFAEAWSYGNDISDGLYQIEVAGQLQGSEFTQHASVAAGSFGFTLQPVPGESQTHQLKRDSSTTFILNLTNDASVADTYQISSAFDFASRGLVWSVDVSGVDQNDRVSLDPGETALVQVKLTPPEGARSGDAARVLVEATSQATSSTTELQLEGQITQTTVADTGLLVLRDRYPLGIDGETRIEVFAWNQGTDADTFSVSTVNGTLTPADPDRFEVHIPQNQVPAVSPGALARVPVVVTTTDEVSSGDEFEFDLEVKSRNNPAAVAQETVSTIVESVRTFEAFGFNGKAEVTESLRFGKVDNSGTFCNSFSDNPEKCGNFTRYAFHRFALTNTGNQAETFRLSAVNASDAAYDRSSRSCSRTFPSIINDDLSGFVSGVNPSDPAAETDLEDQLTVGPGDTVQFFYRLVYDGQNAGGSCTWEIHRTPITITPVEEGITAKTLTAATKLYNTGVISNFDERRARAAPVLLDHTPPASGALQVDHLPAFTGITPGEPTNVTFTMALEDGHEDQTYLTLGPSNLVDRLRDAGWTLELRAGENVPYNETGTGLLIPSNQTLGSGTEARNTSIAHASGAAFPVVLHVEAPTEGLEENERHSFTVTATSRWDPRIRDDLGIGVQIGQDFAFDIEAGGDVLEAHPGDTVAFPLTITNTGASRDTYEVVPSSQSTLSEPNAQPDRISISPRSDKVVSVTAEVPESASRGTHTLPVVVRSANGDLAEQETTFEVEVVPEGTLTVTAEDRLVRVGPSGKTEVNFTVENAASEPRTVELVEVFAAPGWSTSLESTVTRQVPAGGSISFAYLVEAPDSITEESRYPFIVRAQDADNTEDFGNGVAYAVVEGAADVELEPESSRVVVDRGGSEQFSVKVQNLGTGPTWFDLRTSFESSGWTSRILDQEQVEIENASIRVPEQTFKRVLVEVNAPEALAKGHVEELRFVATADGQPDARDEVGLTAEVHDYDVAIEVEGPAVKDAGPGDDVEYTINVTNLGNGVDTIGLSFEDTTGADPEYPVSTDLADDRTPELQPGETLTGIRVTVAVPSPNQAPVPSSEGILSVLRATSSGTLPDEGSPTATTEVTTKVVEYVRLDVDNDGAFEVALDLDRASENGYEVFVDQDDAMVARGEISDSESVTAESLYVVDADGDDRREHLVDTDGDGISDVYFDPDKAQTSKVPYTVDVNGDDQPEEPIDTNFDGLLDAVYDTATDTVQPALHLDVNGDGRDDLLIDTSGDGNFDTFVDPYPTPHTVTAIDRHGDRYHVDSDGDGKVDTYYNVQTQSIEEASTANLKDFLGDYWYFLAAFTLVVGLFVVIVVRRL